MKHYPDIFVSSINVDFSKVSVTDAPREFYPAWFDLTVKLTKAIHPPFEVSPFPETVEFKSDNYETNPITDVYYVIDSKIFTVRGTDNFAVEIRSHEGFQQFDGDDYIQLKAIGLPNDYPNGKYVTSTLRLDSAKSSVNFSVDAPPEFLAEADKFFAEL